MDKLLCGPVLSLSVGEATANALLDRSGKVVASGLLHRRTSDFAFHVPLSCRDEILRRLTFYCVGRDVEVGLGAEPLMITRQATGPFSESFSDPRSPSLGFRAYGGASTAGVEGCLSYGATLRALGFARDGLDFAPGMHLPFALGFDLFGALSLDKGCYLGQETVSKIHHRGRVRQRPFIIDFRRARGEGASALTKPLTSGGHHLGTVHSVQEGFAITPLHLDRLRESRGCPIFCDGDEVTLRAPVFGSSYASDLTVPTAR